MLRLPEAGFGHAACLDFDLAVVDFADEFERRARETVEVPAPTSRSKPTVPKPRWTADDLRRFLGLAAPSPQAAAAPTDTVARLADDILAGRVDWSAWADRPEEPHA